LVACAALGSECDDNITPDDAAKLSALQDRFKTFDVDGDGKIDRDELQSLLESFEGGTSMMRTRYWLPDGELDAVMRQYDKDSSGTIDFAEFTSIVYDGLLLDGKLSEYEAAFNAIDTSGNGTIAAMEIGQLLAQMGDPVSFEKLADIMQQYDKDESGQIEFPEFLQMFRKQLLDVKAVSRYLTNRPLMQGDASKSMLDAAEGDVNLIFSQAEMEEISAQADAEGKMVLVFAALTWCRPCRSMQRSVIKMAQQYKQYFTVVKLFGNSNTQTKRLFKDVLKVRSTPCFMVLKGDKIQTTLLGASREKLEACLRSLVPAEQRSSLPPPLYEKPPAPTPATRK